VGEWAEFEAIKEDQERVLSFTNFERILREFLLEKEEMNKKEEKIGYITKIHKNV